MTSQFFLVRHGATEMNDPANERIRGYSDIPVSSFGMEEVKQAAKFLEPFPVRRVLCSPLQRCVMTAHCIAELHNAKVVPTRGLLPWNVGDYQEQPVTEVGPKMDKLQEHPDIRAPHGESYREFFDRWMDAFYAMQRYAETNVGDILVGVIHSRNMLALQTILDGGEMGDVPVKGGPPNAAVVRVYLDGPDWKHEVLFAIKPE